MKSLSNSTISYFHKHINKQKTIKSFKAFLVKSLIVLILFTTLFFWEGKIETIIKTTSKDRIYSFELEIKLKYIKREESSIHKKIQKHRHGQESKSNDK